MFQSPFRLNDDVVVPRDDSYSDVTSNRGVGTKHLLVLKLDTVHVTCKNKFSSMLIIKRYAIERQVVRVSDSMSCARRPYRRTFAFVSSAQPAGIDSLGERAVGGGDTVTSPSGFSTTSSRSRTSLGSVRSVRTDVARWSSITLSTLGSRLSLGSLVSWRSALSDGRPRRSSRTRRSRRTCWTRATSRSRVSFVSSYSLRSLLTRRTRRTLNPSWSPCSIVSWNSIIALRSSRSFWSGLALGASFSRRSLWPLIAHFSLRTAEALRSLSSLLTLLPNPHDNVDWDLLLLHLVDALLESLCHLHVVGKIRDLRLDAARLHTRTARARPEERVLSHLLQHRRRLHPVLRSRPRAIAVAPALALHRLGELLRKLVVGRQIHLDLFVQRRYVFLRLAHARQAQQH
mmetsp:Transcript_15528/g.35535  ORF Transcript_15528/g.35535 Transcript_15528/m.35535 type:complete len:401 (-) Transcript_15528:179-1381(-)